MLDNKIIEELRLQKILPILNTTELSKDISRLEEFISKSKNIKYIEITLRKNQDFDECSQILIEKMKEVENTYL